MENKITINLKNAEETARLGEKIGALLKSGDIVCLNGDLGAGKTTITQAIARGMGIDDYVTSPTFAIVNEYDGEIGMYHFDTYRLENLLEVDDMGLDDYFYSNRVSVIEWANRIKDFLPTERLEIDITANENENENERIFNITAIGSRYEEILAEIINENVST